MKVVNFATVTVAAAAGGTEIFSSEQARIATTEGLESIVVNPSVDIVIIDSAYPGIGSTIPGATQGTVANGPHVCPAGIPTEIAHRSGPVRAISTSGDATVKIAASESP